MIECVATEKQVVSYCDLQTTVNLLVFVVDYFGLRDNLLAAIKSVGRYTVPQMRLAGRRIDRHCRFLQLVMRTTHVTR